MPILDFRALRRRGGLVVLACMVEMKMDATHLSAFHSVSNCACGKRSSLYVERVTAHHVKRYDHSSFHNLLPNFKTKQKFKHLWEQGCFGVSGALRSLHILRIGRIGSDRSQKS